MASDSAFDPKVFLAAVNQGRTAASYRKGEVIFRQSDPADAVFYIQKGAIKLTVESRQGKEAVVGILGPGEFLGAGCLIGQPRRLATARAMIESDVMRVSKATMLRALHDEPRFRELFMAHLLARNSRAEEDLADQLCNFTEKRLARTLLLLANFGQHGEPLPAPAPISQETLARIVGTTRSRVSQFMNEFRKKGLISYEGHMLGHLRVDSSLLSVVLDEGHDPFTARPRPARSPSPGGFNRGGASGPSPEADPEN